MESIRKKFFYSGALAVLTLLVICACSPMIADLNNLVSESSFEVEYYADGLYSSSVDYQNKIRESRTFQATKIEDFSYNAALDAIPGFTYQNFEFAENSDAKKVVRLIYRRNTITYTFDISGNACNAQWASPSSNLNEYSVSAKFGTPTTDFFPPENVPQNNLTFSADYKLLGWAETSSQANLDGTAATVSLPSTFVSNKTFYPVWVVARASFSVRFFFEDYLDLNPASEWNEDSTMAVVSTGDTFSRIEYTLPDSKQGDNLDYYDTPSVEKGTIKGDFIVKADGTSELKIFYVRKSVTLSFTVGEDDDTGVWINAGSDGTSAGSSAQRNISGKIGSHLSDAQKADIEIERDEWAFVGWKVGDETKTTPTQFPSESTTYVAQWSQNAAPYAVEYLFENENLGNGNHYAEYGIGLGGAIRESNFTKDDAKTVNGMANIGSELSPSVNSYVGFTAIEVSPISITNNANNNVARIYYYRNAVSLTYKADSDSAIDEALLAGNNEHGKFTDANGSGTEKVVQGFYGDTILQDYSSSDVVKITDKKTWEFDDWSITPATLTFPASDEVYVALWTQTEALYTVRYYFEDLSVNPSTWTENESLKKTFKADVGSTTNIAISEGEVLGFATPVGYFEPTILNTTVVAAATSVVQVKYAKIPEATSGAADPSASDITLSPSVNGNTVTVTCAHSSSSLQSLIWVFDGRKVEGQTSATLVLNNVAAGEHTIQAVAKDVHGISYTKSIRVTVN